MPNNKRSHTSNKSPKNKKDKPYQTSLSVKDKLITLDYDPISTLIELAKDEKIPPEIRFKAARLLLEYSYLPPESDLDPQPLLALADALESLREGTGDFIEVTSDSD